MPFALSIIDKDIGKYFEKNKSLDSFLHDNLLSIKKKY